MVLKNYVLDTSVLLHDGNSIRNFEDNDVYIPEVVGEELNKNKNGSGDKGYNARQVIRTIDGLIQETNGNLKEGLPLEGGGKLRYLKSSLPEPVALESAEKNASVEGSTLQEKIERGVNRIIMLMEEQRKSNDDKIIQAAVELSKSDPKHPTIVVSKDFNLRINANWQGVEAQDYTYDKAQIDLKEFFGRKQELEVDKKVIDSLHQAKQAEIPTELRYLVQLNQYLALKCGSASALVRVADSSLFKRIRDYSKLEGIKPRNVEQRFWMDACMDPERTIVCGVGKAGTGKTLIALVAGLAQVMEENEYGKRYDKVVVFRSTPETKLGYLPGNLDEKLDPYFWPIKTAMRVIFGKNTDSYEQINELVEFHPIDLAKGNTYHHSFVIVDDGQDTTYDDIKLIGTRIGEGSKLVLTGDPYQISNPYLDEKSSGLTRLIEIFSGKVPEFAHVTLEDVVRSRTAEIFAELM